MFCQLEPEDPESCPFSLVTLVIEMVLISAAIISLVILVKVLKSDRFQLNLFPMAALSLLLFGSSIQCVNTYYYYDFNANYRFENPPTYQIVIKAVS